QISRFTQALLTGLRGMGCAHPQHVKHGWSVTTLSLKGGVAQAMELLNLDEVDPSQRRVVHVLTSPPPIPVLLSVEPDEADADIAVELREGSAPNAVV